MNLIEFVGANNVQALYNRGGFNLPVYSLSGSRDAFRYRIAGYTGGSDQWIFNDSELGIPSAFFLIWPDRYYHTSGDKPEICDPTQLKRTSFLGAAAVAYLMDDSPEKARKLAGEVYNRAKIEIIRETKRSFDYINNSEDEEIHEAYKEAINIIEQVYKRKITGIISVKEYSQRDKEVDEYINKLADNIKSGKKSSLMEVEEIYLLNCKTRNISVQELILTEEEKKAAKIIPVRNSELKGPLSSDFIIKQLKGQEVNMNLPIRRMGSSFTYEVLNFVDGKNSILDIRNAVSAEFEPVPVVWVKEFLELLTLADIVRIK
jgi:hypothetical protein